MDTLTAAGWRIAQCDDDGVLSSRPLGRGPFTVGRASDCDWVVRDRSVSRYHFHLFWQNGNWRIIDLNSAGGTIVNGSEISGGSMSLVVGARIQIPGTWFVVVDRLQLARLIRHDSHSSGHSARRLAVAAAGSGRDRVRVTPVLQRMLQLAESRLRKNSLISCRN